MKVKIGNATLSIVKGDITEQVVDVITNAANDRFWMGSGVAGAIKKIGGSDIEMEAMRQGPAEIGNVVVTTAGNLNAKHVVHAAVMGQDLETSKEHIAKATSNTIKKVDELKLTSVAIPAFGTGVGHFPAHEAADAIIEKAVDALIETKNVQDVRIVLNSDSMFQIFNEILKRKFSR